MGSVAAGIFPGFIPNWSNHQVLHNNTLPARAHFYTYDNEEAALTFDREQSVFRSLNGTWKFHYDHSPFAAPDWATAEVADWDDIEVPGMWQRQGYGHPHYTNIMWPFPVAPPNISYENPTGSYWREFDVPEDWDGQQIRLRYEGVDSAFHVWVNGEEVGYSQGARNPSEFDITPYLSASGEKNTLATRVYQWSDGSYLEDQDQWWLSGIFRDVYLLSFPESAIVDYEVVPEVNDDFSAGGLNVNVTIQGEAGDMSVKVLSPGGETLDEWTGSSSDAYRLGIEGGDFHLWSAETPTLYTVLITFAGRTVSQKVGLRRIEVSGSNFHVNGQPIILHGVNRHEHNHLSGRTVPYEAMRADLIYMKKSNINAIRTSHQPPHPAFFDVADELGFYVIAEADLECHGFGIIGDAEKWASDNEEWQDAYVDRAVQLVHRFKNHACVIIWSLGNECFYGQNHAAMSEWIRKTDPTRLIHYEPDQQAQVTDMYSKMYTSPTDIISHLGSNTDKPLILCEFAHAMGNGPGGLLEYIALMRSEPLFQGGLVWEWANHGLLTEKNGTEFYGYGGDFGDEPNDGVFIMDGLMLSDHSPMPSIFEYAKVIQPVTVNATSDGSKVVVINHYDFSDLSALDVSWHIVQDGETTEPQPLKLPDVPPRENRTIDWPIDIGGLSQEAWLIVEFRLKEDKPWADKGHVVAWDQVYIAPTQAAKRSIEAMSQGISLLPRQNGLNVTQDGARLHVQNGDSLFGFDLVQGNVTWTVNGVDLFQRGPELYFYRALTSNDMGGGGDSGDWSDKRIGEMHTQLRDIFWQGTDEGVTVRLRVRVAPKVLAWAAEADLVYTITAGESQLKVQVDGDFTGINVPEVVPRIGLMAVMPAEFNSVTWFGRGPGENYKDSKQACRMGRYESNVDDLFTYYDYPQENGNREDLRWLQIGGPEGVTLDARMNQPFSFTASRFMPHDLNNAPHPHDLRPLDMTVLHLDYDNNGLGSASVGPRPFDQYRCWTDPFSFTFDLSLV